MSIRMFEIKTKKEIKTEVIPAVLGNAAIRKIEKPEVILENSETKKLKEPDFVNVYTGQMNYLGSQVNLVIEKMNGSLRVSIPDVRLKPGMCKEIAKEFSKRVYKKSAGKDLSDDEILVMDLGRLAPCSCESCAKPPSDFPYKCKVCGGYFCKKHMDDHGCLKEKTTSKTEQKESVQEEKEMEILIKTIPCG